MRSRMFTLGKGVPIKTWNPFVGCKFLCTYCWAKRLAKRLKCDLCQLFIPHPHEERLKKIPKPKNGIVFVCDMGDISHAKIFGIEKILKAVIQAQEASNTTYFFETKDPSIYYTHILRHDLKPKQTIISTTIETNRDDLTRTLSLAPPPKERYRGMKLLNWPKKHVSVEPVIDFDLDVLFRWLTDIEPQCVSIGYDNYNNRLPEPPLSKTLKLIEALENSGIKVERKTLRPNL